MTTAEGIDRLGLTFVSLDRRPRQSGTFNEHWRRRCDARLISVTIHTSCVDDERPPICPACGVTMVPAALSAREARSDDWICVECEEALDLDST